MTENPGPNASRCSWTLGVCKLQSDPKSKTVETEADHWCDEWVEDVLQTDKASWIAMCGNCTHWRRKGRSCDDCKPWT